MLKLAKRQYVENIKCVDITQDNVEKVLGNKHLSQMFTILQRKDGVGLSGIQVELPYKFFIAFFPMYESVLICCNPSYKPAEGYELETEEEGCLTYPGEMINMERPNKIVATWDGIDFKTGKLTKEERVLEGLDARIFQHEADHSYNITIKTREEKYQPNNFSEE